MSKNQSYSKRIKNCIPQPIKVFLGKQLTKEMIKAIKNEIKSRGTDLDKTIKLFCDKYISDVSTYLKSEANKYLIPANDAETLISKAAQNGEFVYITSIAFKQSCFIWFRIPYAKIHNIALSVIQTESVVSIYLHGITDKHLKAFSRICEKILTYTKNLEKLFITSKYLIPESSNQDILNLVANSKYLEKVVLKNVSELFIKQIQEQIQANKEKITEGGLFKKNLKSILKKQTEKPLVEKSKTVKFKEPLVQELHESIKQVGDAHAKGLHDKTGQELHSLRLEKFCTFDDEKEKAIIGAKAFDEE